MKKILFLVGVILLMISACNNNKSHTKTITEKDTNIQKESNICNIFYSKQTAHVGDTISIAIKYSAKPDSAMSFLDGIPLKTYHDSINIIRLFTDTLSTGHHQLMLISYSNHKEETDSYNFTLLSDIVPKTVKVKVLATYPHDKHAYTQGLFIDNGFLYEGTGQWGQSSLRKIKLPTYEILQSYNLPDDIFGEGIVLYKDEIIQLTWQSRVAFVFDKEEFTLKKKFTYTTEGWGITNYGKRLIMSDGSNMLYVLDPNTFTVVKKIEVFDDNGPIKNLNELENINGIIYANVYQTDFIVAIDPQSGKVIKKIDCSGLLTEDDKFPGIDVLNGIAYDRQTKKIYITGKNWPKLFEVKF